MSAAAFDIVLCALILGAALAAVSGRDPFAAVVFFVVYGVFIATAWLRLDAVNVALAEAAIGAGLTGVLLLGAVGRLARLREAAIPARPPGPRLLAALAAGGTALVLGWVFLTLPAPGGLHGEVGANLAIAGSENAVTAVLLNFRAWDTLLESIVLLAALIGIWALSPDLAWGGRPGMTQHTRPGGVLAQFGRVLPPIGLLVGVYLVWAGTKQPGGAFQGGTVLAAVALLAMMAGRVAPPRVSAPGMRAALILGPAVFLAVGLAALGAGRFLWLPPEHAYALILGIEAALTVSIAVTLALMVIGPPEAPE